MEEDEVRMAPVPIVYTGGTRAGHRQHRGRLRRGIPTDFLLSTYNEFKAVLRIPDGEILDGTLPNKLMKLVQAWIEIHQEELMADWLLASEGETPFKIEPLR